MAEEKTLTKADIRDVLKEVGVATKDDLEKTERRLKRFVRAEIRSVRTDMAKLALPTPTLTEFNDLKEKVVGVRPVS